MSSTFVDTIPFGTANSWEFGLDMTNAKPRTDSDVRASYNEHVSEAYKAFVKEAAVFHEAEQCFGEDLARKAFDTRDTIKKTHQAETSLISRVGIWLRNLVTYGGANATYEGLSKKKNPEEIAYSAFKTDGRDLGLNGNGFGDILDTWNAIKAVSTLYPEDITPAMIEAFKAQPAGKIDPAAILAARTAIAASDTVQIDAVADTQPAGGADIEMILVTPPPTPEIMSKDELISLHMKQGPRRNFAAYI